MSNVISKKIPIPARKESTTRYSKLPFEKMDVGDSICLADFTGQSTCEYAAEYSNVVNIVNRQIVKKGLIGKYRIAMHKTKKKKELRIWKLS